MALLTAQELKQSREAVQAGVSGVEEPDANEAIAEAELDLYAELGYKVETSATSLTLRSRQGEVLVLPQRVRTITSITDDGTAIDADSYFIAPTGFAVARPAGWTTDTVVVVTGSFGFTSSDDTWQRAKKWVRVRAVDYLRVTDPDASFPSEMESYSVEGASFRRNPLLLSEVNDEAIDKIGRHPYKNPSAIRSLQLRSASYT